MQIHNYGRTLALFGLVALAALGSACTTDESTGSTDSAIPLFDGGPKHDLSGVGDIGLSTDLACTPEVSSCSGLCGPVRDNCTGQTFQCGGCASGTVCDLDAHVCITPQDNCAGSNRCGSTKNSCGQTITCSPFYCPSTNDECNPNSNLCQACEAVTCEDLGYQCGPAWLGCGPNTNTVDCGACPASQVCNDSLHICEPANGGTCTLPLGSVSNAQMCDMAATSDGVQCGPISDGCGHIIDCTVTTPAKYTCPTGQTCGGAGIPNHCDPAEPPTECVAAGFNCGALASACGGTVNCGSCTAPDTCLTAPGSTAGVCGVLCAMPMKQCGTDYPSECGTALDNNCWPNKLDCGCPAGSHCSTTTPGQTGTCSNDTACAQYQPKGGASGDNCSKSPSPSFPKGDGTNLTCACANNGTGSGQESCIVQSGQTEGTCCQHPTCDGVHTSLPDPCGGTLACGCPSGQVADTSTGMCCTQQNECETAANKGNYASGTDNCGKPYTCDCSRYSGTPDDPSAGVGHACCAPPDACPAGQCSGNGTASTCSGKSNGCGAACGNGQECNGSNVCCTPMACPNDGKYHVYADDGCGHALTCGCPANTVIPKDSGNNPVNGATCCAQAPQCPANGCNESEVADCHGQAGVDDGASQTNTCGCATGQCCNTGTNTCSTSTTCGSSCNTSVTNCGVTTQCTCSGGDVCNGSNQCACPAATCQNCESNTQSNSCGSSVSGCGCPSGKVCGKDTQTCCVQETCPGGLPAGHACGPFTDTCTGNTFSCGCPPGKPNSICNGSTFQCDCTPTKCCSDTGGVTPCLQPGPYTNDGCGNAGTCAT